jgi:hypothetical protein
MQYVFQPPWATYPPHLLHIEQVSQSILSSIVGVDIDPCIDSGNSSSQRLGIFHVPGILYPGTCCVSISISLELSNINVVVATCRKFLDQLRSRRPSCVMLDHMHPHGHSNFRCIWSSA